MVINVQVLTSIHVSYLINLFIIISNIIILYDEFHMASELIVRLETISVALRVLWPYGNVFPMLYVAFYSTPTVQLVRRVTQTAQKQFLQNAAENVLFLYLHVYIYIYM